MPALPEALLFAVIAAGLGWGLTGLIRRALLARAWTAEVTERSLHTVPTPVGGGLAIVAIVAALWPIGSRLGFIAHADLVGGLVGLAVVSWINDHRPLGILPRLAAQAIAVGVVLANLDASVRVCSAMPLGLERIALALAWLWFINLYNFMDGSDGLAGSETVAIGLGYLAAIGLARVTSDLALPALVVTAATAGFLVWNWPPARIFMGDVGAIPLGFLLGALLLDLMARGLWPAAAILPLYFLADATLTLARRSARGEIPWRAHREHAYQRAVLAGATHREILLRVIAANTLLLLAAVASLAWPWPALAAAATIVFALLFDLSRSRPAPAAPDQGSRDPSAA